MTEEMTQDMLNAAPKQDDAARLVWAMSNMGMANHQEQFAAHVLRAGGTGDLDDCRSYIDSVIRPE